jgi:Tat protein translocase TatC
MTLVTRPLLSQLDAATLQAFRIIAPAPQEGFVVYLEVALVAAIVTTAPLTCWLLWGFIAAGLYPHEKRWVHLFAPVSYLMFVAGVVFLYFVVMPYVMGYLLTFVQLPNYQPTIALQSYVTFFLWMSVIMGLIFQTPLVQAFLALTGLVDPAAFAAKRRHVIAGAVIVAAVVTPPDVVSQLVTAAPFLVLYEVGIVVGRVLWRRRTPASVTAG